MSNRAALARALPAMLLHEGEWEGWYRQIDNDGKLLDQFQVYTWCEFPDQGHWHYRQRNALTWEDGRTGEYSFDALLRDDGLWMDGGDYTGLICQAPYDMLLLKVDRRDSYYLEMITIAPDRRHRARTWQWYKDGAPWKRTLCDERRVV